MPTLPVQFQDPFKPTLFNSPALRVTDEQRGYVRKVLDLACSDSKFSEKAYQALIYIMTHGSDPLPLVNSLNPVSAYLGDPSFTLHVIGTGFDSGSKIIWNGSAENTIFVSSTELTTVVNMDTAEVAIDIPVQVQTSTGAVSGVKIFQLLHPPTVLAAKSKPEAKPVVKTSFKSEPLVETKHLDKKSEK